MLSIISRHSDFEYKTLLANIKDAEDHLDTRKAQLALLHSEIQQFERRYYESVGDLFRQLDEIRAEIAEYRSQTFSGSVELATEALHTRNVANNTTQEVQSRATHGRNDNRQYTQPNTAISPPKPTQSARKMKREIAKLLHPDLVQGDVDKELCHRIMIAVNSAFDAGDTDSMACMLSDLSEATKDINTLESTRIAHLTIDLLHK